MNTKRPFFQQTMCYFGVLLPLFFLGLGMMEGFSWQMTLINVVMALLGSMVLVFLDKLGL